MNALVLAPHVDDEVLGCFSWLGPDTRVCYFGVEERPDVSTEQRRHELENCAETLGYKWELHDSEVNHYDMHALIGIIETAVNAHRPTTLLAPAASYNQDHRAVHDAALVASRPHDRNWFVGTVLLYEQPHSFLWPFAPMEPNYFRPVDIRAKIAAYMIHASQVRAHRSRKILRAMALLRGAQSGLPAAEAFLCKRMVHTER